MSCVCCFFDNEHQKRLKEKCFGTKNFKAKLENYKRDYLVELSGLTSVADCSCLFSKKHKDDTNYLRFTDSFLEDLQARETLLAEIFDYLIQIYQLCEDDNLNKASAQAICYIENYCTQYSSINSIGMCVPLFRARPIGKYDMSDINQFFHFPLSRKADAAEQRFSVQGSVMLYLARSIPTALNETGLDISEACFSLYFPKYSWIYRYGLYSFQNSIDLTINEAINAEFHIEYDNDRFTFARSKFVRMMGDSILFQVLSFPVECKQPFCNEYRLPQLFTRAVHHSPYLGVAYQSSKNTSLFSHLSKYSELDSNYCFFVPDYSDDYNLTLLDCFHHVCIGECASSVHLTDVYSALEHLDESCKIQNKKYNMNDYISLLFQIKEHLSFMKCIEIHSTPYYTSAEGSVELSLFLKLIEKIQIIVDAPGEYGIVAW